jgi:uncharacterized membrane protein
MKKDKKNMKYQMEYSTKDSIKYSNFILLVLFSFFLITLYVDECVNECYAATIHGSTYSFDLDKMQNVFMEVNSTPKQTFVSKTGDYSFELPKGTYQITATKNSGTEIQRAYEIVKIETDGNYNIDLFLMTIIEEDRINNITDINLENIINYSKNKNSQNYFLISAIILIAIVLIAILVFYLKKKKKGKKEVKNNDAKHKNDLNKIEKLTEKTEDTLKDTILKEIRLLDGRATQKELRKKIPYSESKISLVITELEHDGKIKKIKKGRGNIIIINR